MNWTQKNWKKTPITNYFNNLINLFYVKNFAIYDKNKKAIF